MADHEQLLEQERQTFDKLAAKESGVRSVSEAVRENDAQEYSPAAVLTAFDRSLDKSVERFGQIAEQFQRK